jgi:hypothetical protein
MLSPSEREQLLTSRGRAPVSTRAHNVLTAEVNVIRGVIRAAQGSAELKRSTDPALVYLCGKASCSHMVTILKNGEQSRERRSQAEVTIRDEMETLEVPVRTVMCDVHGGAPLPSTAVIREAMGLPVESLQDQPA